MIKILKNNFFRLLEQKEFLISFSIMTLISIVVAIAFTNFTSDSLGNFALITQNPQLNFESSYANVTVLEETPPTSELMLNKYDALIVDHGLGKFTVETIKNEELKETIESLIQNPTKRPSILDEQRSMGTNIIGFLMLFILLQGIMVMSFFTEDKEKKLIERILMSSLSIWQYLLGHVLFSLAFICSMNISLLFLVQLIPSIDIGFSMLQYLIFITALGLFATIFGLFAAAVCKSQDNSLMLGSATIILTTLLSGSFYSFEKGNKILTYMVKFLPQKIFISLVDHVEKGKNVLEDSVQILIFIGISLVFFSIAVYKIKREFKGHI